MRDLIDDLYPGIMVQKNIYTLRRIVDVYIDFVELSYIHTSLQRMATVVIFRKFYDNKKHFEIFNFQEVFSMDDWSEKEVTRLRNIAIGYYKGKQVENPDWPFIENKIEKEPVIGDILPVEKTQRMMEIE